MLTQVRTLHAVTPSPLAIARKERNDKAARLIRVQNLKNNLMFAAFILCVIASGYCN